MTPLPASQGRTGRFAKLTVPETWREVLGAVLNCSEPGLRADGVQVTPMASAFLERVPTQKDGLGRSWAGSPNPDCQMLFRHRNHDRAAEPAEQGCARARPVNPGGAPAGLRKDRE